MEALLLCLDVGVLIAVFMWAIKNSGANGPTTGMFRFTNRLPGQSRPAAPIAPPNGPRWRSLR
jgi:hypothetical protein